MQRRCAALVAHKDPPLRQRPRREPNLRPIRTPHHRREQRAQRPCRRVPASASRSAYPRPQRLSVHTEISRDPRDRPTRLHRKPETALTQLCEYLLDLPIRAPPVQGSIPGKKDSVEPSQPHHDPAAAQLAVADRYRAARLPQVELADLPGSIQRPLKRARRRRKQRSHLTQIRLQDRAATPQP